ncbi:MAG TPA: polysaccharide biosynthesis tyrosine autokinase [Pyrinomonadaceae bacterium]
MKEQSQLIRALGNLLENSSLQNGDDNGNLSMRSNFVYGDDLEGDGQTHLRQYWHTIRKRLWLIIGLVVIVSTVAAVKQAQLPDLYAARARVQVDTESYSPAMGASHGNSYYTESAFMDPEYFNTQVQILSSPTLLRRVVKTLDLEHNRTFLTPPSESRSTWHSLIRMFGASQKTESSSTLPPQLVANSTEPLQSTSRSTDDPAEVERLAPHVLMLQAMLSVAQLKKTRLIDITCTHTDPKVATKVVNATADAFALWNLEVKTRTNNIAGTYLQKRIAELQSQIRTGEEQLVNYAQSHEIISLDASQNTVVERLAGLNRQLLEAENERNLAEASYRATLSPGAAEATVEISDRQVSDIKARLADLNQKRAQLLLTDTEESPEVKDVNSQIAQLERQLEDARASARSTVTTNLETNYRKALDREKALRDAFNKQRAETLTQNQAAINYNILKQEIETNKSLLDGLLQRSKENDVTMAGTPNNIHVVDYSAEPKGPIGPRRWQGVFMALFLSLGCGVGIALFLEYLDDTVKTSSEVERELRLPALAVIPMTGKTTGQRLLPWTGRRQTSNGNGSNGELLIYTEGRSVQGEAYRHLRTSVLLSTPGRAPKTLLVTSSVPAEGKTTTVVNVATVLAQTGARVLVIDADMRRPRLHQVFGMENSVGLSAALSSEVSDIELLAMIDQYKDTSIYLLSSGAIPPNPAELLASEQMRHLLQVAGQSFKYIVIDSPPIASFTDGVLIASNVDGVLLVVQGGKTSRQVVKRTRQMLFEIGAKVIGVVLNKVDVRSDDYYYYHHDVKYYEPTGTGYGQLIHDVTRNGNSAGI